MCPASPATSARASHLIMEIWGWLLCPAATFQFGDGELKSWKILELFWWQTADRSPVRQLGSHLVHIPPLAAVHRPGFDGFPPSSCRFPSPLTLLLPDTNLYGQASACLCKLPLEFPFAHPMMNVKTHPRAPNLTAECEICCVAW